MASSPTQRTLELLRKEGWVSAVVERWNPHSKTRQDLFGFADIIAFRPDLESVLLVQATSTANVRARMAKLIANENARHWVSQPWRFLWVVGWRRYAKAVDRKFVRPTWLYITPKDFDATQG